MKNKNLLSGAYGRVKDKGGSRYYTTPKTVLVPPDYEIDIGEHGDFIACSYDGLLWLFKDKLIVLKWNKDIEQLVVVYSSSINTIADNFIYYIGKNFIQTFGSLFLNVNDNLSIIKNEGILSLSEEDIKKEWKLICTEFESTSISLPLNISNYQFLIKNYLYSPIIKIDLSNNKIVNTYTARDKDFQPFRFISILDNEFLSNSNNYNYQIFYHEGKYWTTVTSQGYIVIGYISDIIPYLFTDNGIPKQYMIYVKPIYYFKDTVSEYEGYSWTLGKIDNNLICLSCYFNANNIEQMSLSELMALEGELSYSYYQQKLCDKYSEKIYSIKDEIFLKYSSNIFFDPYNAAGFALGDNVINMLNDKDIESNAISQWVLAPKTEKTYSGEFWGIEYNYQKEYQNIEAISNDYIISSFENNVLATHITSGFYRELLTKRYLPITACSYQKNNNSHVRLCLGIDNEKIIVNEISSPQIEIINIPFDDFYKNILKLEIKYEASIKGKANLLYPTSSTSITYNSFFSQVEDKAIFYRIIQARLDDSIDCDKDKNIISQGLFPKTNMLKYEIIYFDCRTFSFNQVEYTYQYYSSNYQNFYHSDLIIKDDRLGIETNDNNNTNFTTFFIIQDYSKYQYEYVTESNLRYLRSGYYITDKDYYYLEFQEIETKILFAIDTENKIYDCKEAIIKDNKTNNIYHILVGGEGLAICQYEIYNNFNSFKQ